MPVGQSLDDLIGSDKDGLRDGQPERLRRLQVDDQLELRRLLNGEIARLDTSKDLIHVASGPPPAIDDVRSVVHKTARFSKPRLARDRRQPVIQGKFGEPRSVNAKQSGLRHDHGAGAAPACGLECALEIARAMHLERLKAHTKRFGRGLVLFHLGLVYLQWRPEKGNPRNTGNNLLYELEPFAGQLVGLED